MTRLPTVAAIQRAVALEYGVPVAIMREPDHVPSRLRDHVIPRQVAMTLAARLTEQSTNRIGQLFGGRDRTTVLHAFKSVERWRAKGGEEAAKAHNAMRRVTLQLVRR